MTKRSLHDILFSVLTDSPSSLLRSRMIGFNSFHLNKTGLTNSPTTLPVWPKTLNVAISDADFTMKTRSPTEVPLMTEKDVILMTKSDMTVKTLLSELNKSQLDFQNGLLDTSQPAQDRKITTTKSTEWKNGTTNSRLISLTTKIT